MPRLLTCPQCSARYRVPEDAIGVEGKQVRCKACGEVWHVRGEAATPDALELEDLQEAAVEDTVLKDTAVEDMVQVAAPAPVGSKTMKAKSKARNKARTMARDRARKTPPAAATPANDIDLTPVDMPEQGLKAGGYAPRTPNAALAMREMAYTRRRASKLSRIRLIWLIALLAILAALAAAVLLRHQIVSANPGAAAIYDAAGFNMTPGGFDLDDVVATRLRLDGREFLTVEGSVRNTGREAAVAPMVEMRLLDGDGMELTSWTVDAGSDVPAGESRPFRTELPNPPLDAARLVYGFEGDGRGETSEIDP